MNLGEELHSQSFVVLRFGHHRRELAADFRTTTNNRMELLAGTTALRALTERCCVPLQRLGVSGADDGRELAIRRHRALQAMRA